MPITEIKKLTDGLNELMNPRNLPMGGLQESSNYETLGDDVLTKRKDPVEYGDHVSGDSLKTVLATVFTQSITQIAPPYYPVKKLSDMTGDFILLVYGSPTAGTYELYMTYENDSNTWTLTKVDITGIEYTSNTYLEFFIGDDKLIITDTYDLTKNFPHYVKVDADGELITGLFSIKSPTNKPTLLPTTEFNSEDFEEDGDAVRLGECGIVQCAYTVITKEGDESNPSPISNSRMLQFFKKDLIDKNDERWIDNFQISNLSVPILTGDLAEQLKYFNVYFRIIRYSEGEAAQPFYFSQRFDIVDKKSNKGDTGNGYLVSVPQDESAQLSYENDIAPYAKHAAEVSGIVGLANIREKTKFPFNFEKFCPIEINNINNKNFVDAIVQIRIYDGNNTGTLDHDDVQVDMIEDLDLTYYNRAGANEMTKLDEIRIYDDDKTTPIKTIYNNYNGQAFLDVFVKIPLLIAGQIKYLYLCFNTITADDEDLGVITQEYKTTEYGQFTLKSESAMVSLLDTERVKSSKAIICSPMDYQDKNSEIINLVDDNNPGEIEGDEGSFDSDVGTKELLEQYSVGGGRYLLRGNGIIGSDFSEIRYGILPFGTIPDRVTMWGRISYTDIDKAIYQNVPIPMFSFYQSPAHTESDDYKGMFLSIIETGEDANGNKEYRFALYGADDMTNSTGASPSTNYSNLTFEDVPISVNNYGEIFLALSINKGDSASLFLANLVSGNYYTQKTDWDNWNLARDVFDVDDIGLRYYNNIDTFAIGFNNLSVDVQTFSFRISQFQLLINKYYDGADNDDVSAMWNLASFLPTYEKPLGTKIELATIE